MTTAFPLQWPAHRSRTSAYLREHSRFDVSNNVAQKHLLSECERMGGKNIVISTNIPLRRDGLPYSRFRSPDDPGVAVYFQRGDQKVAFSCDRYIEVWENMRAIGKTIEAMRGIERWGAHEVLDQMFQGFTALPPPEAVSAGQSSLPEPWSAVLGVDPNAPWSEIRSAFRSKMREATDREKYSINAAYDAAKREFAQ